MGIIYRLLKATGKVWRLGEGRRKQNSLLYRLQRACSFSKSTKVVFNVQRAVHSKQKYPHSGFL